MTEQQQVEDTLDVTDFTVGAMLRTGLAIRKKVKRADSMEEAADTIVRLLYERCCSLETGERSCVLVRFYKTHRFEELPDDLRQFASRVLGGDPENPDMRCLTLMATTGDKENWNRRQASAGHQAIPLPSAEFVNQAPMIRQLIVDIGLDVSEVVEGSAQPPRPGETRNYEVFHVEHAEGSPHIPAQEEFVVGHGVKSVIGFGGLLRSGELFAVIMFSRHQIPAESASRFRSIALDIRSALFSLDDGNIWLTDG